MHISYEYSSSNIGDIADIRRHVFRPPQGRRRLRHTRTAGHFGTIPECESRGKDTGMAQPYQPFIPIPQVTVAASKL